MPHIVYACMCSVTRTPGHADALLLCGGSVGSTAGQGESDGGAFMTGHLDTRAAVLGGKRRARRRVRLRSVCLCACT